MATKRARSSEGSGATTKEPKSRRKKSMSAASRTSSKKEAKAPDSKIEKKKPARSGKREAAHAKDGTSSNPERNGHVKKRARPLSAKAKGSGNQHDCKDGLEEEQSSPHDRQLESKVASTLQSLLESYAEVHGLGRVAGPAHFDWGEIAGQEPQPALAFVSFDRWAPYRTVPTTLTWHVVPDLVVEIDGESQPAEDVNTRLNDYFKAGVSRVWVVRPHEVRMLDYQSPSEFQAVERDDFIDGGSVLPGFQYALNDLVGEAT